MAVSFSEYYWNATEQRIFQQSCHERKAGQSCADHFVCKSGGCAPPQSPGFFEDIHVNICHHHVCSRGLLSGSFCVQKWGGCPSANPPPLFPPFLLKPPMLTIRDLAPPCLQQGGSCGSLCLQMVRGVVIAMCAIRRVREDSADHSVRKGGAAPSKRANDDISATHSVYVLCKAPNVVIHSIVML